MTKEHLLFTALLGTAVIILTQLGRKFYFQYRTQRSYEEMITLLDKAGYWRPFYTLGEYNGGER